ncbi:two-component system sensor with a ligand-binding domain protein [Polaribacter sp. IC066]|nr:two-component system sensor with a ligand-binding domain protein [Polaribacter sp. IC063]TXD62350.1 two-component system sensor with a ligand-binding domain protein [Polaribacter sp. IC066]
MLALVCSFVNAQNPSQIDVLTTEQGLPFRDITSITQDATGAMWFGTDIGLIRYNGYNFKVYNSDQSNPYYIEEELITGELVFDNKTNELWYLANEKLFKLQLSTDKVIAYNHTHNIKGNVLRILKAIDGSIWIMSDDFLSVENGKAKQYLQKLTNEKFEVRAFIKRPKYAYSRLINDTHGNILWSASHGNLKFDSEGNLLNTFQLSNYTWHSADLNFTVSFYNSDNIHYFFPRKELGIFTFDEKKIIKKHVFNDKNQFYYAIEDHQKQLWFASSKKLYRMNLKGEFVDYTAQLIARFEYSKINYLFIDANKLLWVATDNGLFKIQIIEELFKTLFTSKNKGWANTMRGLFEDENGTVFAKCESENKLLYKTKNGTIATLQIKLDSVSKDASKYRSNFYVLDDKKQHVFTIGDNLLKINLKDGTTKSYPQFNYNISLKGENTLIKLKSGKILLGQSLNRLLLFDPETETSEFIFKNPKTETDIADFRYFKESKTDSIVWIGTQNDGVLKIHLNGRLEKQYKTDSKPSISRNFILVMEEDADGGLWVGTYAGGLNHISADGNTVTNYTKNQGLPDDTIVGILTDEEQNLWISTYNGISKFNKNTEIFQNFYDEDGLSNNEFNYSSFYKSIAGDFYFGGMNGLTVFKPSEILKKSNSPKLRFLAVSGYNSKEKKNFNTDYSQTKPITLKISPYDQYFEVSWMMTSYFQNTKNTYSTKLEGFEDRWFNQGNKASIRYNQLPAGHYTLKVKGTDSSGNASVISLSIPIIVQQVFYKKWGFISLIILAVFLVLYAIFKYRLHQILAMERLRTKIASDLHDDVGSMLSGLAMQTELLETNANDADKWKLQKIAVISRNAISQMRDLVWSIDSRRQTTNDLVERMQELAEDTLLPLDITFQLETSSIKHPNRKLSPQIKQNLFLICKEAITNIIRHSDANQVTISIVNQKKGSHFTIKDNGKNIGNCTSTGLGLLNMEMRAKQIKGKLKITKDAGFCIQVYLPFNL